MNRVARFALAALGASLALAPSAFAAPPANDTFPGITLAATGATTAGTNVEATRQAGETNHNSAGGTASVWYEFTPASNGAIAVDVCNSNFNSAVAVYTATAVGSLGTAVDSDPCRVEFPVVAAQSYKLAVDGALGDTGQFTLILTFSLAPGNDTFTLAETLTGTSPNVDGDNRGASREGSEPDHFPGAKASVWYRWTAPFTGGARVDACVGDAQNVGVYTGTTVATLGAAKALGECGATFEIASGITYFIAVDGARAPFNLQLESFAKPANDDFLGATVLTGNEVNTAGDNRGATRESLEPSSFGSASVWYRWTPLDTGTVEIDVCDSGAALEVSVRTGTAVNALTVVRDFDDCFVVAPVTSGTEYRILVATPFGQADRGTFRLGMKSYPKPGNDNIAAAQVLSGSTFNLTGDTRGASAEIGEPDHHPFLGLNNLGTVWYRWTAPSSGRVRIEACGQTARIPFGFSVAAYTPTVSSANLTDRNQCGVLLNVVQGTEYLIAVQRTEITYDSFVLRFTFGAPPPNDNFSDALTLTGANVSASGSTILATSETAEPVPNVGTIQGDGGSVWYRWTAPASGVLRYDMCGSDRSFALRPRVFISGPPLAQQQSISVGTSCTPTNSAGTTVAVVGGTEYILAVEGHRGAPADFMRRGNYVLHLDFTDSVNPDTTITNPPNEGLMPANPSFAFTSSEPNSTFECSLDGGAFASCTSPKTYPGLGGTHTFEVRATDSAGLTDNSPAQAQFTVDTVAPDTTIVSGPPSSGADVTPTFRYSSNDADAGFECRIDGGAYTACNAAAPGSSGRRELTTPALADGSHTFEVRAVDIAGNRDPQPDARTFVVDASPPVVTITSAPTDISDNTPTFRFSSSEPGSAFTCRIDEGPRFPCSTPSSVAGSDAELTTHPLANGERGLEVSATDAQGNSGPPSSLRFSIDTSASGNPPDGGSAPETVIKKAPKARVVTRGLTKQLVFEFSSPTAGATFECAIQRKKTRKAALAPPSFGSCTSPKRYKKKPGIYRFTVRAVSSAGTPDATPSVVNFTIVRPAPAP